MIDFKEKLRVKKEATERLVAIKAKSDDKFNMYCEIDKIKELNVAKEVIKLLLDEKD